MFNLKNVYENIISDIFGGGGAEAEIEGNQAAIAEQRRQFDITQASLAPFIEAGTRQLPGLEGLATPGGLDAILGQIFGGEAFQNLRGERTRAVEGQLAAGGLTRSGTALQEIANVPTDIGFQIEQLLTGRKQALAGQAQTGATNLGQFGAQASGNISDLISASGRAESAAQAAGQQNILNTAATAAAIFFSDPNLKENIEEIGDINGLKLYQWDWIEKTKGTMIEVCSTIGFMADEVKEKHPEFVYDFCGFMVIDYPQLLDDLQEAA